MFLIDSDATARLYFSIPKFHAPIWNKNYALTNSFVAP